MAKVFVDITELMTWEGRLTGVPRVMDELSRRFYSDGDDVSFVQWIPQHGYVKANYSPDKQQSNDQSGQSSKRTNVVKNLVTRVPFAKPVLVKIRQRLLALKSRRVSPSENQYVKLEAGDVLLVLADWHGSDRYFVQYLINVCTKGVKLIQVVHDMLPIVTPQYSGHSTAMLEAYSRQIYPLCDLILANSENTKRDTEKWLKGNRLKVPDIQVFRLGDDFFGRKALKPQVSMPKRFILCVGTIEARKNHMLLYYVYKLAENKGIRLPKIVIVGRLGWLSSDVYELITKDPQTKDNFIFLHGTSDDELAWLYGHCLFTVYPSFYEGWGLPVAESMMRGVPCIASNTSSIPEVAGNLALYFDPASPDECLQQMQKLLDQNTLAKQRRRVKKYKATPWDETYLQVKTAILSGKEK